MTAEPRVCVARWERGKLTVWDSLQYTFQTQAGLAALFKIPMSKVRVICDYMGGGFGDKIQMERYSVLASILSHEDRASGEDRIHQDDEYYYQPFSNIHRYACTTYSQYSKYQSYYKEHYRQIEQVRHFFTPPKN